ncbi:membrane protein [Streptomyces alboflavus]|uniref:Membrane protein n=1 Tax=Streptomyces alboflavus TaxID=67267 RepID=A0A1Z1WMJ0_9ACTN|nr:membrane protein [Streptomyces alboflavus]
MVSNRPASAVELQRRAVARTGDPGLLAEDGASRGNLFSGGADQLALVLSMAARRGKRNRSRAGYFAYFSDPANAVRTALSFVAEVGREIGESTRARLCKRRPRVSRGGLYPFIRAFATVVERDVVVAAVIGDMLAGRAAVYADLVAYDEVAHHSGPTSGDAERVLRRLDRSLALIEQVADHAPRLYRIVLLSDHGQSPGETFRARYGLSLADLVRAGCGLPVPRRAGRTHSGAEARSAVRAALRRPVEEGAGEHRPGRRAEPIVLASGNLGLVSFPDVPHRMTREEIDRRHPALLPTLANHPGVGFVLVRSEEHGPLVLGARGAEVRLDDLDDLDGRDDPERLGPLDDFGPGAADAVRRTDSFPHTADIMVNSWYDPEDGEVLAFEEQIGSHGGLGGAQSRPFLLSPLALSPAARTAANSSARRPCTPCCGAGGRRSAGTGRGCGPRRPKPMPPSSAPPSPLRTIASARPRLPQLFRPPTTPYRTKPLDFAERVPCPTMGGPPAIPGARHNERRTTPCTTPEPFPRRLRPLTWGNFRPRRARTGRRPARRRHPRQ